MSLFVGTSTGAMSCLNGDDLTGNATFIEDCINYSVEHMDTVSSSRDSASSPGSTTLHTVDSDQLLSGRYFWPEKIPRKIIFFEINIILSVQ